MSEGSKYPPMKKFLLAGMAVKGIITAVALMLFA